MNITQNQFSVLGAMPGTKAELMLKTKLSENQTYNALRALRKKHQAFIGIVFNPAMGGPPIPVYWAGQGQDAENSFASKPDPVAVERAYLTKALKRVDKHIASLAGTQAQWFSSLPNARACSLYLNSIFARCAGPRLAGSFLTPGRTFN